MGSRWTLNTMLQRPGSFAYYGIFRSGWFDPLREDLLKNHSDRLINPIINKETKLIWIPCGGPEDAAYKKNLAMEDVFRKHKISHTFIQGAGGRVWDIWRRNLRDIAPLLFRQAVQEFRGLSRTWSVESVIFQALGVLKSPAMYLEHGDTMCDIRKRT